MWCNIMLQKQNIQKWNDEIAVDTLQVLSC